MAISKITIEEFLTLAKTNLVLDVRSPSEYAHAHIPKAKNLPLFNDDERKIVGTAYKQESKEIAIKLGLGFFGKKMREMVEEVERLVTSYGLGVTGSINASNIKKNNTSNIITFNSTEKKIDVKKPSTFNLQPSTVLLHCWRGGMRSAGVAWLLDLYGFKVYTLIGGYKAYRNWVLQQFEKDYHFKIIGGYTGSGKTLLLEALAKENNATIDLEGLANHKGSALGGIGQAAQPSQEMFENLLAEELDDRQQTTDNGRQATGNRQQATNDGQHQLFNESSKSNEPTLNLQPSTFNCIWLEDESQRIGNMQIPMPLWRTMRSSKVYFFDIPFEERLNYLTEEYGVQKKDELVTAIMRIQKRLGGLETKTAINFLLENNFKESFRILLTYYDKYYLKGLYNRENAKELITTIETIKVDTNINIELLSKIWKA
jgi:tRNA 2-selenouridine synthase